MPHLTLIAPTEHVCQEEKGSGAAKGTATALSEKQSFFMTNQLVVHILYQVRKVIETLKVVVLHLTEKKLVKLEALLIQIYAGFLLFNIKCINK